MTSESKSRKKTAVGISVSLIILNIALIAIFLSLVIVLWLKGPCGGVQFDLSTILGSFIAICTTFVVGFQIWNYIYYTNKLDALDAEKEELREKIANLDKARVECMYFNAYTIGRMRYQMARGFEPSDDSPKYYWNALRALTNALRYAAEGGHEFDETYQSVSEKIFRSIDLICSDAGHLAYDQDSAILCGMALQINKSLQVIKDYINSDIKLLARYPRLLAYSEKWDRFQDAMLKNA